MLNLDPDPEILSPRP